GTDPARARLGRAPVAAAGARRGAPVRGRLPPAAARREGPRVDLRHAPGSRPGPPAGAAEPLRLGRALPGGDPGGARGRARDSGANGALDLRATAQSRPRLALHHRDRREGAVEAHGLLVDDVVEP